MLWLICLVIVFVVVVCGSCFLVLFGFVFVVWMYCVDVVWFEWVCDLCLLFGFVFVIELFVCL